MSEYDRLVEQKEDILKRQKAKEEGIASEGGFPTRPLSEELAIIRHFGPAKIVNGQIVEDYGPRFVILHIMTGRILCQAGERQYTRGGSGTYYYPILFTHKDAEKWVKDGNIGELQEGYTNLQIGFVKNFWAVP